MFLKQLIFIDLFIHLLVFSEVDRVKYLRKLKMDFLSHFELYLKTYQYYITPLQTFRIVQNSVAGIQRDKILAIYIYIYIYIYTHIYMLG